NREISLFLTQVMERNRGADHTQVIRMISFASDLESSADVVENSLLELARKKHNLKLEFSDEGWSDISQLQEQVVALSEMSLSCFQTSNRDLAAKIVAQK